MNPVTRQTAIIVGAHHGDQNEALPQSGRLLIDITTNGARRRISWTARLSDDCTIIVTIKVALSNVRHWHQTVHLVVSQTTRATGYGCRNEVTIIRRYAGKKIWTIKRRRKKITGTSLISRYPVIVVNECGSETAAAYS